MIGKIAMIVAADVVACAVGTASAQTFNGGGMSIPEIGPANPYPSTIAVSGVIDPVSLISVTITNFTHSFGDDAAILLVGPNGNALILADGPGDGIADELTWMFTDSAAAPLPNFGPLASGTFKPGQNQYSDVFTAPAPTPDAWFNTFASAFAGSDANGTWSLYVEDFVAGDAGSIGSWSITFGVPSPGALVMLAAAGLIGGRSRHRYRSS